MSTETVGLFRLAVVIPAYRAEFLGAALDSLHAQTSGDFHVYVGDDASPDGLEEICELRRSSGLSLTYQRFESNLGALDLVAQWNRCVRMSRGEEWVWLFSDDDIADPRCVAEFQRALSESSLLANVYRFNTVIVNAANVVTEINPPHPAVERVEAFAYHRMRWQRKSFAPEHIFRRTAFDTNDGFVNFPFAMGSDDASWITFAGNQPIVTLPTAVVYWRSSHQNVSIWTGEHGEQKLVALGMFSRWIGTHFKGRSPFPDSALPMSIDLNATARAWFDQVTFILPSGFRYYQANKAAKGLNQNGLGSRWRWTLRLWLAVFRRQRQSFFNRIKRRLLSGGQTR